MIEGVYNECVLVNKKYRWLGPICSSYDLVRACFVVGVIADVDWKMDCDENVGLISLEVATVA